MFIGECEACPPPVVPPTDVLVVEGSDNAGFVVAEYVDHDYKVENYLVSYKQRSGISASSGIGIELLLRGFGKNFSFELF